MNKLRKSRRGEELGVLFFVGYPVYEGGKTLVHMYSNLCGSLMQVLLSAHNSQALDLLSLSLSLVITSRLVCGFSILIGPLISALTHCGLTSH